MLSDFELELPGDLPETLAFLARNGAKAAPLAGGTNLLVDLRARREPAERLVWLGNLEGFRDIRIDDGRVAIGGGTTIGDILRDPAMIDAAPSLVAAAEVFGGQMVRNQATIAGNVCSGSPAADTVPPLLSLDAEVHLTSADGARVVPLDEFYTGFKKNCRHPDELVTGLSWRAPGARTANLFYKLARRKGDAITVAGVAVTITSDGERCTDARIALGAVAPTVFRAKEAEAMLIGEGLTEALIDAAARRAMDQSSPIDDIRASADYRKHAVHVLTRRLVTQAWQAISRVEGI